jgi:hypothetical protein
MRPLLASLLLLAPSAGAELEDAGGAIPSFQEGDILSLDDVDKLKPFLPEQLWDNRDFFFYEGMQLEIGPTMRDYTPNAQFKEASEKYKGQARIGPDESLENYTAGRAGALLLLLLGPRRAAPPVL